MPEPERALPHIALATFCERVIQDKADDVVSIIRVFDTLTLPATAKGQFAELTAVIGLRSGDARGTYKVEFVLHPPAGGPRVRLMSAPPGTVQLDGGEQGATFGLQIRYMLQDAGLYWLDLEIEGHVLTRIPLRINYAAAAVTTS